MMLGPPLLSNCSYSLPSDNLLTYVPIQPDSHPPTSVPFPYSRSAPARLLSRPKICHTNSKIYLNYQGTDSSAGYVEFESSVLSRRSPFSVVTEMNLKSTTCHNGQIVLSILFVGARSRNTKTTRHNINSISKSKGASVASDGIIVSHRMTRTAKASKLPSRYR